jgi:hypothetical protein
MQEKILFKHPLRLLLFPPVDEGKALSLYGLHSRLLWARVELNLS